MIKLVCVLFVAVTPDVNLSQDIFAMLHFIV